MVCPAARRGGLRSAVGVDRIARAGTTDADAAGAVRTRPAPTAQRTASSEDREIQRGRGGVHSDLDEGAAFLSARGLDVAYGSLQVLYGVDFDVRPGEVVALLGTNGAGKSTLVRALSGLTPARRGTVTFDGHDVTGASPEHLARLGIAHAPGGRGVYPGLTVGENLRLAMWTFRSDRQRCDEATERVFELFHPRQRRPARRAPLRRQAADATLPQPLAPTPLPSSRSVLGRPAVVEEARVVSPEAVADHDLVGSPSRGVHVASGRVLEKGTCGAPGRHGVAARDDLPVVSRRGGRRSAGSAGDLPDPERGLACADLTVGRRSHRSQAPPDGA